MHLFTQKKKAERGVIHRLVTTGCLKSAASLRERIYILWYSEDAKKKGGTRGETKTRSCAHRAGALVRESSRGRERVRAVVEPLNESDKV